jgi:hypothetical protein
MSRHLTRQQARAFRDRLAPMLRFLYRCRTRIEVLGFDREGALYRVVADAYDVMNRLDTELYRDASAHGNGRNRDAREC